MLEELELPEDVIKRVSYLVAHHHTYDLVDGPDYQILLEADMLVNLYEDRIPPASQRKAYQMVFRTETGKKLCRLLYPAAVG